MNRILFLFISERQFLEELLQVLCGLEDFDLIFADNQILRHWNLRVLIYFYMKVCGRMKSILLILTSFLI